MANPREIRRRIRSVNNIAKVTNAMETVAASKMRRAQQQVLISRPYAEKSWEVLSHLARLRDTAAREQPLLQARPVKTVGLLLITSDKGLAGAYLGNIIRAAARQIYQWEVTEKKQVRVISIGKRGRDWMLRHGPPLEAEFPGFADGITSKDIAPIARILIDDFVSGAFDAVYIAYTRFVNTLRQDPVVRQLLPIVAEETSARLPVDYIFEPDPETILGEVLQGFVEVQILQAACEALASEQSARMVAMRNATESAHDLIDDLTLSYNKARQETITDELLDIVGGATALAQIRGG